MDLQKYKNPSKTSLKFTTSCPFRHVSAISPMEPSRLPLPILDHTTGWHEERPAPFLLVVEKIIVLFHAGKLLVPLRVYRNKALESVHHKWQKNIKHLEKHWPALRRALKRSGAAWPRELSISKTAECTCILRGCNVEWLMDQPTSESWYPTVCNQCVLIATPAMDDFKSPGFATAQRDFPNQQGQSSLRHLGRHHSLFNQDSHGRLRY